MEDAIMTMEILAATVSSKEELIEKVIEHAKTALLTESDEDFTMLVHACNMILIKRVVGDDVGKAMEMMKKMSTHMRLGMMMKPGEQ